MYELETKRLILRPLNPEDSAFIFRLLNEPSWIKYIGDKKIYSLPDAVDYIKYNAMAMYAAYGVGLLLVQEKDTSKSIGLCGLIKRAGLEDIDLGFAYLPEFWGRGFAHESAEAVVEHGRAQLGLSKLVAITLSDNLPSVTLIKKLNFQFVHTMSLDDGEELNLYSLDLTVD